MKRLVSKILLGIAAAGTLLVSPVEAYEMYDPCCSPCGQFYVDIEALYWNTNHHPIFANRRQNQLSSGSADTSGRRSEKYILPDYDWGVRGRIGYDTPCYFADISYLYYCSDDSQNQDRGDFDQMFAPGLGGQNANNENPFFVNTKAKFKYQNVDFRYGHYFCVSDCFKPFVYFNARWVRVDFDLDGHGILSGTTDGVYEYSQDSKFNGGGLGFGVGTHYSLWCNFGIGSHLGTMALIGETKNKFSVYNDGLSSDQKLIDTGTQSWCHVIPGLEFRIGLDYAFCWCSFNGEIEVGYEINQYFNILRYASINVMTGTNGRIPPIQEQDIGFAGPFFRLGLHF